jgi:elongation factor 2 kinase
MVPNDQCRTNLGKVHYQLAVLHGRNRFPEVVVSHHDRDDGTDDNENLPDHDAQSVLFHLSHAASLLNTPACLALARVLSGRTSCLSDLLPSLVPLDFELAKELLERAMMTLTLHPFNDAASSRQSVAPKVAAGCLLIVLLLEERQQKQRELEQEDPPQQQEKNPPPHHNHHFRRVLSETLDLYEQYRNEQQQLDAHRKVLNRSEVASASWASSSSEGFSPSAEPAAAAVPFHIGDRVEANYALEGTFYPAKVARTPENIEEAMDIALDSLRITVQYDDDGSSEDLPVHQVRHWIPPTATQTRSGGPLLPVSGDGAAFGSSVEDDADCELLLRYCEVQALLAEALEHEASADGGARTYRDRNEDDPLVQASALYERAAEEAAQEGMMHKATAWSLKSAELLAL